MISDLCDLSGLCVQTNHRAALTGAAAIASRPGTRAKFSDAKATSASAAAAKKAYRSRRTRRRHGRR